jgi:hypothetical protein
MLLPAAIFVMIMAIDVAIPVGVDAGVRTTTTFAGPRRSWQ